MNDLVIRTHVGRDVLQSAQLFRTPEAAIWEYVVNSLQYRDPAVTPQVEVILDAKRHLVIVEDNGVGMDFDGLTHFFTMHGENQERRKGMPGRGKFGTGKSAAFGIGTELEVDTVRDGVRQVVRVTRAGIEAAAGDVIPVEFVERDQKAAGVANGTVITIRGVTAKLSREPVVSLIERHLATFRNSAPVVTVDGRICEIPVIATAGEPRSFAPPSEVIKQLVGDITLSVRVSRTPLGADGRGIAVTVGEGNLVALETAGVDAKEFGDRLFGEVDCPRLEDPSFEPTSAFGNNRDLRLNPSHPVAAALTAFIGSSLEQVRQTLVAEHRASREDAAAKRIRATTDEISKVLNEDLQAQRERITGAMANVRQRSKMNAEASGSEVDENGFAVDMDGQLPGEKIGVLGQNVNLPEPGPDVPHVPVDPHPEPGDKNSSAAGRPDASGEEHVTPAGGGGSARPRGGLNVTTDNLGADFDRMHWDKESRTIIINLDHPVVTGARTVNDGDLTFRRLMYEIAFTSYAVALADLALERDEAMTGSDATFEVRSALRRVWANAGSLYTL